MLTVSEHLEFIAKAYRLDSCEEKAETLLRRFELDDKRMKLGKELSKGMQQKVSVCCALLPQPKALILDEPLIGLDQHGIRELKTVIMELRDSGCALFSASKPSAYFVAIPSKAANHIQNNAPGPPATIAVATPTILPVPMVADKAVHNAAKLVTSPVPPSSFKTMNFNALGK
jgi:hypothetical protein